MHKKILFFVCVFVVLWSSVAYAATSNSVNYTIATANNATYYPDDDKLLASAPQVGYIPDFGNTVFLTDVQVRVDYYDMSNVIKSKYSTCDSSGHFSISRPDDFASFLGISIVLNKKAFPSSGKYKVQCLLNPEGGGTNSYNYSYISFGRKKNNVEWIWEYNKPKTFTMNYSQAYWESIVQLGSFSMMEFIAKGSDFGFGFNGHVKIAFTEILDSSVEPDISSPGSGSASQDVQQGIQDNTSQMADNTSQLVDGQNQIVESLKDIVQTISYQLEAFWLQLAHEFTNLYNKMNEQHAEIMQAISDGLNVSINNQFGELIENDNKNHQEQMQNDDKNSNFIIESIKGLFIPSDTFFKTYFDDLYDWFSERFGFLSFPIDLLVRLVDLFVGSTETDCILTLPSFSIMNEQLWPDLSFNLTDFLETHFNFLLVAIRMVTSIYLIMGFVQLCERKWNEVMMN